MIMESRCIVEKYTAPEESSLLMDDCGVLSDHHCLLNGFVRWLEERFSSANNFRLNSRGSVHFGTYHTLRTIV